MSKLEEFKTYARQQIDDYGDIYGTSHYAKDRKIVFEFAGISLFRNEYDTYRENFPPGQHLHNLYDYEKLKELAFGRPDVRKTIGYGLINEMVNRGFELRPSHEIRLGDDRDMIDSIATNGPADALRALAGESIPEKDFKWDKFIDWAKDATGMSDFARDRAFIRQYADGVTITREDYNSYQDAFSDGEQLHSQFGPGIREELARQQKKDRTGKYKKQIKNHVAVKLLETMQRNGLDIGRHLTEQMNPALRKHFEPDYKDESIGAKFREMMDIFKHGTPAQREQRALEANKAEFEAEAAIVLKRTGITLTPEAYKQYSGKKTLKRDFEPTALQLYHKPGSSTRDANIAMSLHALKLMERSGFVLTTEMIDNIPEEVQKKLYTATDLKEMRHEAALREGHYNEFYANADRIGEEAKAAKAAAEREKRRRVVKNPVILPTPPKPPPSSGFGAATP